MKLGGWSPLLVLGICAPFWGVSAPASAQMNSIPAPHFAPAAALLDDGVFRPERSRPGVQERDIWGGPSFPRFQLLENWQTGGAARSLQPTTISGEQGTKSANQQGSRTSASSSELLSIDLNIDGLPDKPDLPDAPEPATPSATGTHYHPERANARVVTWKSLPRDFIHDQKDIWFTFPGKLATGHHWVPVLAVAGVTAGLIYADPHIMPYFRDHQKNIDKLNDVFDPMITTGMVIALPAGLLAAGYARHDNYQISTGLMGALAYGDSVLPNLVIKAITRRERPSDVPPGEPFTGTFFNGGKSPLKGSSFPSGHATAAFSVATVVAYRYRNHKWVPILSYGLATAIGLSRVATMAHFPSDVFLGSAMGYGIARYQTVRPQ
jgi:membrane-associated phospholipid phosphatase